MESYFIPLQDEPIVGLDAGLEAVDSANELVGVGNHDEFRFVGVSDFEGLGFAADDVANLAPLEIVGVEGWPWKDTVDDVGLVEDRCPLRFVVRGEHFQLEDARVFRLGGSGLFLAEFCDAERIFVLKVRKNRN